MIKVHVHKKDAKEDQAAKVKFCELKLDQKFDLFYFK